MDIIKIERVSLLETQITCRQPKGARHFLQHLLWAKMKPFVPALFFCSLLSVPLTVESEKCGPTVISFNATDRRSNKEELVVANYNVEWLFLNGGSGNVTCPGECPWKTKKEALSHLNDIAKVIAKIGTPDILHLNEVESCEVVMTLVSFVNHALGHDSQYAAYLLPSNEPTTGQNVALLTKVRIPMILNLFCSFFATVGNTSELCHHCRTLIIYLSCSLFFTFRWTHQQIFIRIRKSWNTLSPALNSLGTTARVLESSKTQLALENII